MSQYDSTKKIWSGPQVDRSEDGVQSFRETVLNCLRSTPDKVFQICDDDGSEMTYFQLEVLSIRVAKNLQKYGVRPNDVISVFFQNTALVAPIVVGCFLIGAPINPIICRLGVNVEWIKSTFSVTRPSVIIMDTFSESHEMLAETLHEMGLDPKIFLVGQHLANFNENLLRVDELLKETGDKKDFMLPTDDGVDDQTYTFILPSSGTTGVPKSVSISASYTKLMKYLWRNREDAVCFSFNTINWITGILNFGFVLLNNGLRIVTTKTFSPKTFGKVVKKYQVTSSLISVENLATMYGSPDFNPEDFVSFRELYCGGERVPISMREHFKAKLPNGCFTNVYGSSECATIAINDQNLDTSGITDNVVGKLFTNVRGQIIDLSSRTPLGPNKVGEIFLITETMMSCYYKNPELTAKVFDGCWYKTGDVGYFDENGFLHVHGRIIDMMTINGEQIHPAEIESFFEACKGIRSACAVSVTDANLLAVLCTRVEGSTVTEDDLKSKASFNFTNFQFSGGIYIVKEIPRTITNSCKIHRGDASELALKLMTFRNENNSLLNSFK